MNAKTIIYNADPSITTLRIAEETEVPAYGGTSFRGAYGTIRSEANVD